MGEFTIVYWDEVTKTQKEREMTQEERAQRALDMLPPAALVPRQVTRRQARQALFLSGYLDQAEAKINGIADATQRRMATIEWQDSQVFERYRPLVIIIGTSLGLNSAGLDALFIQAGAL